MKYELSDYGAKSTVFSPVNKMMSSFAEDFREEEDINLGVGYVNEETIPRNDIKEALIEVLDEPDKYPFSLNYGASKGALNLRKALAIKLGLDETKKLIIGANGATSLLEAFAAIHKPGIIITSDPWYYIYCNYLKRLNFKILTIPEDSKGIRTDLLIRETDKPQFDLKNLRFFYIVSVGNPSSAILSDERKIQIINQANKLSEKAGRLIPVIFDRAYEELIHEPGYPAPVNLKTYDHNNLLYEIGSLSKVIAPALRIGFLSGADTSIMKAVAQRTNDAGFSASLLLQYSSQVMLDKIEDLISLTRNAYHQKALKIKEKIDAELGNYIEEMTGGSAGFYFYITFRKIKTNQNSKFYAFLARKTGINEIDYQDKGHLKPRVIYLPGEFTVNPDGSIADKGSRQIRISYAFEKTTRILKAIDIIKQAAQFALKN